ncbi:hypothetical protein NUACC21_74240 [Scytonema sp. NUACC21]
MAKHAEDRYQSAFGLKHDLEKCLHDLKQKGYVDSFKLAQRDISDRFLIPEKLYGRVKEVEKLLEAFERVSQGNSEMMMVGGFSGIGKTAVVNEVHKPITKRQGYFIKGKYDQYKRDVPLSAFVEVLQDLIEQLLSESDAQLQHWKDKILAALGENGQVIIDVIPTLEQIIGPQPPVLELSATATQNRFNLLFQHFIQVFANTEHPLVIFLDDLQWADLASLKLMQLLMTETGHVLMIGAYRDNEVSPTHPLMLTLQEIQKAKMVVNTITLSSLTIADINSLIADTMSCSIQRAQSLTELVYQKTKGNPFFTNQFLKFLYNEGLICFDFKIGSWQCDIARVKMLALTEDILEFMARQLQKLPIATQLVLKLAACIGNSFDLATLAIICEKTKSKIANDLWKALQAGLIIPTTEVYKFFQDESIVYSQEDVSSEFWTLDSELWTINYKFLHDRVQQAAYSLIPEDQKQATHFKIGRLLLKTTPKTQQEEKIFEIVNQLNYGIELITQETERDNLASLNLIAGRKAKFATAYTTAMKYLRTGMQLLAVDSWENSYELTLAVYQEAAEAAYLAGEFEQMEKLADVVLQKADLLLDKMKVYEVQILALGAQIQPKEAVRKALVVLKMLGQELPFNPSPDDIQGAMAETTLHLNGKCVEDLIDLPEMTAAKLLAAMRILSLIITFSYQAVPELFPLILFKLVNLSLQHGNSPLSAFAYVVYGLTLCGVVGDIDRGYQFGKLALNLLVKFNAREVKAKVLQTFNTLIRHWKEHTKEMLQPLLEAYSAALETGDIEFAALSLKVYSYSSYFIGKDLATLKLEMAIYSHAISQLKQEMPLSWTAIFRQIVLNLLGEENPCCLRGESYDEKKMLPIHQQANDRIGLLFLFFSKLHLYYLFEEFQQAVKYATLAEKHLDAGIGQIVTVLFYFYDSLSRLAVYPEVVKSEQKSILDKVHINQEKLQKWAQHAPMNYLHKFYLVEAERYRVLAQKSEAIDMYDRAIFLAKENEYVNEEALAQELAAKFYLEWGKQRIAQDYLSNAYYCYARWGAKAKVDDLEKRYPQLLTNTLQEEKILLSPTDTVTTSGSISLPITGKTISSSTSVSEILDLRSIIKASQTLSSEIQLDKLLAKLMEVVMENAGAKKCALILPYGDRLAIEALAMFSQTPTILQSLPVESSLEIPITLIYYVKNTLKTLVMDNAASENFFAADAYLNQHQTKSILCTPILNQGKLIGILYLENSLTPGAFTKDRVQILNLLVSQAAISLENARLYHKSQELYQKTQSYAQQLESSLANLQQMQLQLIQSEKMSALGNLVASVAHEINNPVGFIVNNLEPAQEYIRDLFHLIDLYQQHFPHPGAEILETIEAIDLEYVRTDLFKLINSLKLGTDRIRNISNSLRIFSRNDTTAKVSFNIHEGLDCTLLILKHRLKANDTHSEIVVIKNYSNLPSIECFPGQLNQVFMNILANAIDAIEESLKKEKGKILIQTKLNSDNTSVVIKITDNGLGIPDEIKSKIFNHLFTTKAVGKGTGLGLSIAHQIVVEQHQGVLEVNSVLGQGSEFTIILPI